MVGETAKINLHAFDLSVKIVWVCIDTNLYPKVLNHTSWNPTFDSVSFGHV